MLSYFLHDQFYKQLYALFIQLSFFEMLSKKSAAQHLTLKKQRGCKKTHNHLIPSKQGILNIKTLLKKQQIIYFLLKVRFLFYLSAVEAPFNYLFPSIRSPMLSSIRSKKRSTIFLSSSFPLTHIESVITFLIEVAERST